jgi:hypothetical protein
MQILTLHQLLPLLLRNQPLKRVKMQLEYGIILVEMDALEALELLAVAALVEMP